MKFDRNIHGKGAPMMKSAALGALLLNCIILLACTRVHVEILRSAEDTEKRTPPDEAIIHPKQIPERDPGNRGGPGAALRSGATYLTDTEETPCATDRNLTQAVAQETGVWCWAASARGVLSFHNVTPYLCAIVNRVKAGDATTDDTTPLCCENNGNALCQQNGWPDEVFESYGIDYRWVEGPLSQRQIAAQICGNGPFAYSIAYEGGGGHTFVVKDYWMDEEEMWLWVDTHEYFTDAQGKLHPTGFKELSYQQYANGWYDNTSHNVDFTYILIKPQV